MKRALARAVRPVAIPRHNVRVPVGLAALAGATAVGLFLVGGAIAAVVLGLRGRWGPAPDVVVTPVAPGWYVEAAPALGCYDGDEMARIQGALGPERAFFGRPTWSVDGDGRARVTGIERLDAPGGWLTAIYLGPLASSREAALATQDVEGAARAVPGPPCLSTALRRIP